MREDLLGYLLSALEPHEMRQVERQLRNSPVLQEELEFVRQSLEPLDREIAAEPVFEAPHDLISKTLAMLPVGGSGAGLTLPSMQMAPVVEIRRSFKPGWSDLFVAGLAAAAILALLVPTVARGRYEARRVACQENLRQIGTAITQYVLHSQDDSLPQIASSGLESFAGMYAVRLAESDLLNDPELRLCPEVVPPTVDANLAPNSTLTSFADRIVRLADLRQASEGGKVDELRWMQQVAGGDYAYNLGVVDGNNYAAPRYEGRATFAVLGDAPTAGAEFADGVDVSKFRWGHGNSGANLLFEDGSVKFVDMGSETQFPDHPFLNHRGAIEAGVNIDDASLAPSWRPPFISARQR